MVWTNWERLDQDEFQEIIYEKKYHKELKGGIARITINRPHKYNAFTNKTQDEMFHAFYDANHDLSIGVIVLTGAGDKAFCTGGDVEWEIKGLREQFYWRQPPNQLLRLSRKPVIVMVKGFAIGAGNHLAYMADFTIAADNATFGQAGPRVGSPADGWIAAYLTRVVGSKKAREMWMLCRKYNAQQALEMGLINEVAPLDKVEEVVDKWCAEILSLSPGCIEILKASFDSDIDYMEGSMGKLSRQLYPDWFDGKEFAEGTKAFMEKRKPEFWKIRMEETENKK